MVTFQQMEERKGIGDFINFFKGLKELVEALNIDAEELKQLTALVTETAANFSWENVLKLVQALVAAIGSEPNRIQNLTATGISQWMKIIAFLIELFLKFRSKDEDVPTPVDPASETA